MKKILFTLMLLWVTVVYAQRFEIFHQSMHTQPVYAVAFSPKGDFVVSGSDDKTLKFWDTQSGFQLDVIKLDKFIREIAITPDGKYLLIGVSKTTVFMHMVLSGEGELIIMDLKTRKEIKRIPFSNWLKKIQCSADSKYAYLAYFKGYSIVSLDNFNCLNNLPTLYDVQDIAISPDMKLMAIGGSGTFKALYVYSQEDKNNVKQLYSGTYGVNAVTFSPDSKAIAYGTEEGMIYLLNTENFKRISSFSIDKENSHKSAIRKILFSKDGRYLVSSSGDINIKIWDVATGRLINSFNEHKNSITDFEISPSSDFIISSAIENDFKYWDLNVCKSEKKFNFGAKMAHSIDISSDTAFFATASADNIIRIFDYHNGRLLKALKGHTLLSKYVKISPDSKYILSASSEKVDNKYLSEAILWDAATGKMIKKLETEGSINSICFSPDSKQIVIADWKPFVYDIDLKLRHYLGESLGYSPNAAAIYWLNKEGQFLITNSYGKSLSIQNWKDENSKLSVGSSVEPTFSNISPDLKYYASYISSSMELIIWSLESKNRYKNFKIGSITAFAFSVNSEQLATVNYSEIKVWDIVSQTIIKTIPISFGNVLDMKYTLDNKYLLLGAEDGTIRKVNLENNEWIAFIGDDSGKQWAVYNNDGYWDASTQIGNIITMKDGSRIFGIDQMAVWSNRPDKIYGKFGASTPDLIDHYKYLYLKRLKKLDIKESDYNSSINLPKVEITNIVQNQNTASLTIDFSKNSEKIARYNIFVNDVPLFGASGKKLEENYSEHKEVVELTEGNNKIEVSCFNSSGIESLRALTYAKYNERAKKDLYFLGFGVSKYKNRDYNLKYAHKDALDLGDVFSKLQGFENIKIKVLTNEQVTPDAIKDAKDFVKEAKPDDVFVLYIAGHGIHDVDPEATYYYLTYNADLENLKGTSADFETIEDLLQGIPPRNKLFLMDACESGEIEEGEFETLQASRTIEGVNINSRGFKSTNTDTQSRSEGHKGKRNYLYQKDSYIYNDLVRRSGTIVFSSSKGGELSYERSDIKNGLFTEYIMKALTTTEADKDNNGTLSTDELRLYVSEQVAKSSGDMQHPTVDRDNIYQKFGFDLKANEISVDDNSAEKKKLSKDLFPLYGITIGKSTTEDLDKLGNKAGGSEYYFVNGLMFYYDKKNIVNKIAFDRFASLPEEWGSIGFSKDFSYNNCIAFFTELGYKIEIKKEPSETEGSYSNFAEFDASKKIFGKDIVINVYFMGKSHKANAKGALFSMTMYKK